MLNIRKEQNETSLTVYLEGKLDTITAPEFEAAIKDSIEGVTELVFDMEKLEYITSAGLRVLLSAQKTMNDQGTMIVKNVNEDINDVFEVTGFSDFLNIE
ncbi:MAG: STAS domain-containing protein [Solobacterium sp.]|nr:STAS domain-containing protein [Solobacterium sp.]